jgi:hypothetical protein
MYNPEVAMGTVERKRSSDGLVNFATWSPSEVDDWFMLTNSHGKWVEYAGPADPASVWKAMDTHCGDNREGGKLTTMSTMYFGDKPIYYDGDTVYKKGTRELRGPGIKALFNVESLPRPSLVRPLISKIRAALNI